MAAEAAAFDEVVHAPHRLRICAMLSAAHRVEFAALQAKLDISKSALSEHLAQLADAGYVTQEKEVRDSRSRLWLAPTTEGARVYRGQVRALQQIVAADPG